MPDMEAMDKGRPTTSEAMNALLGERSDRIEKLIEVLAKRSADTDALAARMIDTQLNLQRLEIALFGHSGNNGLSSQVKSLDAKIDSMRQQELVELKQMIRDTRNSIRNWALAVLPVIVMVAGVVIAAVQLH